VQCPVANRYKDLRLIPIDLKNCNLYILDATGSNYIVVRIGEGTLTYSTKRDVQQRKSRGNLWQIREGEEQVTEVSFQFIWDSITSSGDEPPTVEEALYGLAPGWTSASAGIDPNGPFTTNLQLVNQVPCYGIAGGFITETFNFPIFSHESFDQSVKDSTVDCKGFSNRTKPIIVRS
jgi:hypothetical protein